MKKFLGGMMEWIITFYLIFLTISVVAVNVVEKSFITICNIMAIFNLIWLFISFNFLLFAFFIKGDSEVLAPTDWGAVSHSFFNFYFHPHGVLRICLVGIIIVLTLWRWVHFVLGTKFVKENYIK